jgi:peroxiredoxin family protein
MEQTAMLAPTTTPTLENLPLTEPVNGGPQPRRLAIIASKGTLDWAYPPLMLATTAASMGWEVAIYFTFYGLYIIHKNYQQQLQVSPVGNPAMPPPLPAFPQFKVPTLLGTLPGMTAMATDMMKGWMERAHLAPLTELLGVARDLGVKLYACNTMIGVMGVDPDDLIEGVERAGSPAFLDFAAEADVQLFI